jgi:hypothetical protein
MVGGMVNKPVEWHVTACSYVRNLVLNHLPKPRHLPGKSVGMVEPRGFQSRK